MDNVKEFLAEKRKQFTQIADEEKPLREDFTADLKFEAGDQWDENVKATRERAGRPVLTFNRIHTFVQQVSNEVRQQKPQIKYIPAEDSDKETAEVYEGLARHIQYSSDAQEAYETGLEYAAAGGLGYYRHITDYVDDETENLELKVVTVNDPLSIYGVLIPSIYGAKCKVAFVIGDAISKEEFKALYPDSELTTSWDVTDGNSWITTEKVTPVEIWWVTEEKKTVGKRTVTKCTVHTCKTNGVEILDDSETIWPGSEIPIFAVLGKKRIVEGKPKLYSVTRFQRDAQKLINGYKTRIAETLSMSLMSPYMAAPGQITGENKRAWETANSTNRPYLEAEGYDLQGRPVPPPSRMVYEPPIQALSGAAAQEIDDMKATAGIYDASLGAKGNETSGIAIGRRQQQSDTINMHFIDNLGRSFSKSGKAMAEVLPIIYDTERIVRIMGPDEQPKLVKINGQTQDGKIHKIGGEGVAKYDVVVSIARAFSSKRSESFDMMGQLIQSAPGLLNVVGDVMFQNSDTAGADILAERFKKMLPPNLQDEKDQQMPIPPQVQQQMQAMQQDHMHLNAYAQQKEQEIEQLKQEKQARVTDNEYKLELERMRIEASIAIAEINAKAQDAMARVKLVGDLETKLQVQDAQHGHEAAMAAADANHQHLMANVQQQHGQMAMEQQAAQEPVEAGTE